MTLSYSENRLSARLNLEQASHAASFVTTCRASPSRTGENDAKGEARKLPFGDEVCGLRLAHNPRGSEKANFEKVDERIDEDKENEIKI